MSFNSHPELTPKRYIKNEKYNNLEFELIHSTTDNKIKNNLGHVGNEVMNVNEINLKVVKV